MKKCIIISLMLLVVSMVVAIPISLTFKELPPTNIGAMYDLVKTQYLIENPDETDYPNNEYCVQFYISFDDVIDPLDVNRLPTGDDVEVTSSVINSHHTSSFIAFPPIAIHPWSGKTLQAVDPETESSNFRQGRKTYMRIFNASLLENATKYVQFNGLYTIPTAIIAIDVFADANINGFTDWIDIPSSGPTPVLQWATVVAPLDGAEDVALGTDLEWSYPAAGDEVLAADGFEVWVNEAMVYDGPNLTYAHNLAYETPYTWYVKPYTNTEAKRGMKASRLKEYPEGEMPVWTFTTMAEPTPLPSLATLVAPVPEEGEDMAITEIATTLEWAYEGSTIDGFEVTFNGNTETVANDVFEYPVFQLAYNTTYEWSVRPFRNPAAKGMKASREGEIYPEDDPVTWSFTTTNDIPVDGGIVITVPVGVTNPAPVTEVVNPDIPDVAVINVGLQYIAVTTNQFVSGLYGFTFTVPQAYATLLAYVNGLPLPIGAANADALGQYAEVNDLTIIVYVWFDGGAKESKEIIVLDEATLPVELSSFTAVAHANEYVTLKWVTESESNLYGFNVYRAETDNQDQAIRINPTTVAPNNTTQTTNYTYTDNEVEATTYYYWLEVAELSNENTFHGPIVVTVEDDPVVPGITETTFRNFGPSPFTTSTSTTLRVKEGETASVTIYNLLGQVVRRESFNAGEHNFTFNGKDTNNKSVANGIYFVKMTSPSTSKSFKIVKIK